MTKVHPDAVPSPARNTRSGFASKSTIDIHERGDKVVVNGAKESILTILNRHSCDCGKHNLAESVVKFLKSNNITASYDIIVWIFIYLRLNCESKIYKEIAVQYTEKMIKKRDQDESHQSQKYIATKKKALNKFIESAKILQSQALDELTIEESVQALYSKGKSRDNALNKIKAFLTKSKIEGEIQFTEGLCKIRTKISIQESEVVCKSETDLQHEEETVPENSRNEIQGFSRENEEKQDYRPEDKETMQPEYFGNDPNQDLFDQLIQNYESDSSLFGIF